ncbi:polymorphic toxin type 37 domain-containing protein [Enterobacterales bacterium AE_CKDN230030158-1A_HGKHYDSX7]
MPGTTGSAHGGPHWDVQNPRTGKHTNIYPGGKKR